MKVELRILDASHNATVFEITNETILKEFEKAAFEAKCNDGSRVFHIGKTEFRFDFDDEVDPNDVESSKIYDERMKKVSK